MMNSDYILSVIWQYADECLIEPRQYMPGGYFEQCSYQRWAVNEIMRRIEESEDISPIKAVENFIRTTYGFLCRKGKENPIFLTAYDVATDILGLLIAMDENECSR